MSEILDRIPCPNCRNEIEVMIGHGESVDCPVCHQNYVLNGRLCPDCGRYHEKKTAVCSQCHHQLVRVCDECTSSNWAGDEVCQKCGTPLDVLSGLKVGGKRPLKAAWIEQINRDSEAASQERMAGMMEKEAQRQADAARYEAKKSAEDQKMVMAAIGGLAAVIILVILFILLF